MTDPIAPDPAPAAEPDPVIWTEPVTLAEARTQCRLDGDITDEDTLISTILIPAARRYCEQHCQRPLLSEDLMQWRGQPAPRIELAAGLVAVESVNYMDADGVEQTLPPARYYTDTAEHIGTVQLLGGQWPAMQLHHPKPLRIQYRAGWPTDAVPADIKQAMLLLIAHWYDNREAVVIGTITSNLDFAVAALLAPYRIHTI